MTMLPNEEEQVRRDVKRQRIIEEALHAADRIILNGSDGSREETNYLTAQVADRMMKRALLPFTSWILNKDMGV